MKKPISFLANLPNFLQKSFSGLSVNKKHTTYTVLVHRRTSILRFK